MLSKFSNWQTDKMFKGIALCCLNKIYSFLDVEYGTIIQHPLYGLRTDNNLLLGGM